MTMRALVVDDNPMNAHLARVMLSRAGLDVAVVESAPLALEHLAGNPVDAVLSDISMPHMSGKDLCREIRRRYREGAPRIIAYTAFAMHHQMESIREAGFDAIVVKPASSAALVAAVLGKAVHDDASGGPA